MDRQLFEKLFNMDIEDVKKMHAEAWDQWTWDDSSPEVKQKITDIETYMQARKSMGLDKT